MSGFVKPPFAYVHGDMAIVPGRVAAWLEDRFELERVRVRVRGADPLVDAVLTALGVAATTWRERDVVGTAVGTHEAPSPEPAPPSKVMTTEQAASRCGLSSPRAIVRAIEGGRLKAEKFGGRWLIDAESFAHYLAARAAA